MNNIVIDQLPSSIFFDLCFKIIIDTFKIILVWIFIPRKLNHGEKMLFIIKIPTKKYDVNLIT